MNGDVWAYLDESHFLWIELLLSALGDDFVESCRIETQVGPFIVGNSVGVIVSVGVGVGVENAEQQQQRASVTQFLRNVATPV